MSLFDGPVRTVAPESLKRAWEFLENRHAGEMVEPKVARESPGMRGIDVRVFAEFSAPSDDPQALGLRSILLRSMAGAGMLNAWKTGGQFTDSVFQLASAWELQDITEFDPEKFLQELEALTKPRTAG